MNRAADGQADDKGRMVTPLVVICIAIALIYLPMACGLSPRVDFGDHIARLF